MLGRAPGPGPVAAGVRRTGRDGGRVRVRVVPAGGACGTYSSRHRVAGRARRPDWMPPGPGGVPTKGISPAGAGAGTGGGGEAGHRELPAHRLYIRPGGARHVAGAAVRRGRCADHRARRAAGELGLFQRQGKGSKGLSPLGPPSPARPSRAHRLRPRLRPVPPLDGPLGAARPEPGRGGPYCPGQGARAIS